LIIQRISFSFLNDFTIVLIVFNHAIMGVHFLFQITLIIEHLFLEF
jgi:hypothetical protein